MGTSQLDLESKVNIQKGREEMPERWTESYVRKIMEEEKRERR